MDREDEGRLLASAPTASIVVRNGEHCVAARPEGGACQFLEQARCRVHAHRPAPCREFPLSVHVGARLQATLVLSCPGIPLGPLLLPDGRRSSTPYVGFDEELASVRARIGPRTIRLLQDAQRRSRKLERRLSAEGRWTDEDALRSGLARHRLVPSMSDYSPEAPPATSAGLEQLPIYFDGRSGPVALGEALGGWEALELAPEGGARPLGIGAPPERRPDLSEDAELLLGAYLRYFASRDAFRAAVEWGMLSSNDENVLAAALRDLLAIGSTVIARGALRAQLQSVSPRRLGPTEIELGIRATDQDWLDRPTWGSRL